jgi:Na+/H+ antiporter NhaD/arsenite permease-like protein
VAGIMALAAGSTRAKNPLILRAANNVIIIPKAERNGETSGIFKFTRVRIPVTFFQALVYLLYFAFRW